MIVVPPQRPLLRAKEGGRLAEAIFGDQEEGLRPAIQAGGSHHFTESPGRASHTSARGSAIVGITSTVRLTSHATQATGSFRAPSSATREP